MLEFLKSNKNRFVGIDFGTSSIKVVELSYKDQKVFLENYGFVDLKQNVGEKQNIDPKKHFYEQKMAEAIKKLVEMMDLKSKSAYVSIPGFSGLITIIELPEMENDELAKAIQFEAHKYIPSSLDEIAMSWEIIEHISDTSTLSSQMPDVGGIKGKKIKVLLVAAPKKDVERFERLLGETNVNVAAIELETFSIVRSLINDDAGNFLIIDIGSRATNIILVEKGVVVVNRNIDAGGNEITSTISESMNISKQRGEDLKKGEKDFLNSNESRLVIPILEFIASESKRILDAYKIKNKNIRIDGVLLSGGTSKMKGLEQYLSNFLKMDGKVADPWRRIMIKDNNVAALIKRLGGSFTVALGLALRGAEEYKRK